MYLINKNKNKKKKKKKKQNRVACLISLDQPDTHTQTVMDNSNESSNEKNDTDSAWQDLNHSIQSITSNGQLPFINNKNNININGNNNNSNNNNSNNNNKHPRQVDDTKIREALELPPPTNISNKNGNEGSSGITQDKLKYTQISKCSFYKNHQFMKDDKDIDVNRKQYND